MSTSDIVGGALKQLDHRVAIEETRLPWWRRTRRRYVSGRAAATFIVAKKIGFVEGALAGPAFKASLVAMSAKFPLLAVFAEHVVAVFEGVVTVGSASS